MDKLLNEDELPVEGLVKQELITYKIKDGKMHKTIYTRTYQSGADYIDSTRTEVLVSAN